MAIDILLIIAGAGSIYFGYKTGFLRALFSTIGYVGGGVLGLVIALHFVDGIKSTTTKFLILFIAILVVASIMENVGASFAKFFRMRILWSPIRFVDSIAGVALQLLRAAAISYLGLTVLLGSPWNFAKSAVSESKIYEQMVKHEPSQIHKLRAEIEKKLSIVSGY